MRNNLEKRKGRASMYRQEVWHTDCKVVTPPPELFSSQLGQQFMTTLGVGRTQQFWPPQQTQGGEGVMSGGGFTGACGRTGCTHHEDATWSRLAACHPVVLSPQTVVQPCGATVLLLAISRT